MCDLFDKLTNMQWKNSEMETKKLSRKINGENRNIET